MYMCDMRLPLRFLLTLVFYFIYDPMILNKIKHCKIKEKLRPIVGLIVGSSMRLCAFYIFLHFPSCNPRSYIVSKGQRNANKGNQEMTNQFAELAQMTINQMMQDKGVIEAFMSGKEEARSTLAIEYMQIAVQKNEAMSRELISYPWKLEAFAKIIACGFDFADAA